MNTSIFRLCAGAAAVAAACAIGAAHAAQPKNQFDVPAAQLQALGIRVEPLQAGGGATRARYPAQVVAPAGAELVLSAPVAGMVAQVLVQPYQPVQAGAPLLRLASPELGQLQLQLMQAASRARLARQAAQRDQALYGEGIIAQRRLQDAQAAQAEADAGLAQAKAALRLAGMPANAIGRVAAGGAPQDSVTLSAPQAGTVQEIEVRTGQRVESAAPLLRIVRAGRVDLEIQLPAAVSAAFPAGAKLNVSGRGATAKVTGVSAGVAAGSQTALARATVDSGAGALRPGELVTVELADGPAQVGWDLPLAAVAYTGEQAYVFVRTRAGFEARTVRVVASARERVRVAGTLAAGEQIAVSGLVALKGAWLAAQEGR